MTQPVVPVPPPPLLRPLGAFERVIDFYMHRNPVQFSLVVALEDDLDRAELVDALQRLQQLHPLLAAEVDRRGDQATGAAFRHSDGSIPVRVAERSTWQQEAAREQTEPLGPTPGPLARTVLVPGEDGHPGATVLMTLAHQVADGRGALRAVLDLLALLAGSAVSPGDLPAAQEDLLADLTDLDSPQTAVGGAPQPDAAPQTAPDGDPATAVDAVPPAGQLRPFDGSLPAVQTGELGAAGTRALVARARDASCTVQGALCAAAARTWFARTTQPQMRINVPVDLRGATGLADEVVVRFSATTVVLDQVPDQGFWDLARLATAQLRQARDPAGLRAAAIGLAGLPVNGPEDAEAAMLVATAADLEITNLGVVDAHEAPGGVQALWGPTMTTQVAGEQILGVVTHGGVLRLVNLTHHPVPGLVDDLTQELRSATG